MFKKIILMASFISMVFAGGINWYTDVTKAQIQAKSSKKIIFVFVEAAHCPYCQQMLQETLSDKDVIRNINKDYIAIKVDADSSQGQKYFGNIAMTPTSFFYSPNGKLLETLEGFQNVEFFFWGMGKAEREFKKIKGAK